MRRLVPTVLLLFALAPPTLHYAPLRAQTPPTSKKADAPFVTLPTAINGDVGDWLVVKAATNCKALLWSVDPGLTQLPPEVVKDGPWVVVVGKTAGTYKVSVVGTLNDTLTA